MKLEDVKNQFGFTAIMKQEELLNHLESAYWLLWKVKDAGERARVDWIKNDVEKILKRIESIIETVKECELELEEQFTFHIVQIKQLYILFFCSLLSHLHST